MNELNPSPILLLNNSIASALFAIVPERALEVSQIVRAHNIYLEESYTFQDVVWVKNDKNKKVIGYSVPVAETLWATSFLAWVVYQEMIEAQRSGAVQYKFGASERCAKALSLHNHVWKQWRQKRLMSWPAALPVPRDTSEPTADSNVATEMFLSAMAWIFHHELSHVLSGDLFYSTSSGFDPQSIRREIEADRGATERVLGTSIPEERFRRAIGIVTAMLWFVLIEIEHGNPLTSHPPVTERIDRFMRLLHSTERERLSAFVVAILQVVFNQLNIPFKHEEGESWDQLLANALSALEERRREMSR